MTVITKRGIDWEKTLIGLKVNEEMKKTNPSPQIVPLARTWASKLKREKGLLFKVSLKGSVLIIKRLA